MSPLWGNAIGVFIVIIMLTFIGIWIWAWRSKHKAVFERMANMPMEDSPEPNNSEQTPTHAKEETPS